MKTTQKWLQDSYFISKEFLGFNLMFTVVCLVSIWSWQAYSLPIVFWLKVTGYAIQTLGYVQFRSTRFIFFYNLGLGKRDLLIRVLLLDLAVSFVVLIPCYVLLTD